MLPGGRAGPAPGPLRLGVPRHPRRRGRRRHRRRGAGDAVARRLLRRGVDPPRRAAGRRRRGASRPLRCLVLAGPQVQAVPRSTTRRSCTGCSRRRRAGCGTRTGGGADADRPVPAGRLPGRRRRERAGRPPGLVLPEPARRATTRCSRPTTRRAACSGAGRSSSACCRGRSRTRRSPRLDPRVRALRLEQPPGRRAGEPRDHAGVHGRLRRTSRRGRRWRPNLEAFAERTGVRVRYGCRWTATRREPTADGDTFVLETTDGEYRTRVARHRRRHRRAVPARRRRGSSWPPTTPTRGPPRRTPASGSSSSASRTPGSSWRPVSCRGRAGSSSPRRRRRSCRSTRGRSSASGRATSSRSRTTSWAAAWRSSTRRSSGIERLAGGALEVRAPTDRRAATSSRSRSTR